MTVAIDISQTAYQGTGVARYVEKLVENLLLFDTKNQYRLFFSSLRQPVPGFVSKLPKDRYRLCRYFLPPTLLDLVWNRWHILPLEFFVGQVDVFFASDWTQPPTQKAKIITTIHDLAVLKYPGEFAEKITTVQNRRLAWVKKEASLIFCDSQATVSDVLTLLKIGKERLKVIYPGIW